MGELTWGWVTIACVLAWRLAPEGIVITRKDLASLPHDRVLKDHRDVEGTLIRFSFVSIEEAQRLTRPVVIGAKPEASVSELQGKWQKIACVLLWKMARDGITLTQADRDAMPADRTLLMHGHAQDLELRFLPHAQAARIAAWERDNEGHEVMERVLQ
jgi:hypothetical protein